MNRDTNRKTALIIGAGPAGLTAAYSGAGHAARRIIQDREL